MMSSPSSREKIDEGIAKSEFNEIAKVLLIFKGFIFSFLYSISFVYFLFFNFTKTMIKVNILSEIKM